MKDWIAVCQMDEIAPDTGVCATVNGEQVAVFRFADDSKVYAISNYDPFGKANVLSRGIIGSVGQQRVVASPLYKQHFDLETGVCLEDDQVCLRTYSTRIEGGMVELNAIQSPEI